MVYGGPHALGVELATVSRLNNIIKSTHVKIDLINGRVMTKESYQGCCFVVPEETKQVREARLNVKFL